MEPTIRQQRVLDFIETFISIHGYPPTLRDMSDGLDLSSPSAVMCHLRALEKKGYISRGRNARALKLLRSERCPYCKQEL